MQIAQSQPATPTKNQLAVVYTSSIEWCDDSEHALLMACSDPRFREETGEFMERHCGLTKFDPLFLPGGPACILLSSSIFFSIRPLVTLLDRAHSFRRIIGVAHEGCRYYVEKFPRWSDDEKFERQLRDLKEFSVEIKKLVPEAKVELFYARPREGRVQFLAVGEA